MFKLFIVYCLSIKVYRLSKQLLPRPMNRIESTRKRLSKRLSKRLRCRKRNNEEQECSLQNLLLFRFYFCFCHSIVAPLHPSSSTLHPPPFILHPSSFTLTIAPKASQHQPCCRHPHPRQDLRTAPSLQPPRLLSSFPKTLRFSFPQRLPGRPKDRRGASFSGCENCSQPPSGALEI